MPLKEAQQKRPRGADKRKLKERSILRLIHSGFNISRFELARKTGVSPASITAIVKRLIKNGIVVEAAASRSSLGRRPVPLEIRAEVAYLVGVDIGSYYLRTLVTDINGNVVCRHQTETALSEGRDRVLKKTIQNVHGLIKKSGLLTASIKGIGIAHSGIIDSQKGVVLSFPRPGQLAEWKNIPLKALFEKEFGVPCLLEDSVRTAAAAESRFGLGKSLNDFLYIDVGMGIGAAIFFDGKLYRGKGGKAGEFGHITVDENGPLCSCGNNGCLETVASCAAIIRAARTAVEHGVDSTIVDLAGGNVDKISIELIAQAAAEKDSVAFRVLQGAASYIAAGLADLINILNPVQIIFGGALFRAAPQLLSDPFQRIIRQRTIQQLSNDVQLMVSSLDGGASALGASRLIAESILDDISIGSRRTARQYDK